MIALLDFLSSLPSPRWTALVVAVVLFAGLIGWGQLGTASGLFRTFSSLGSVGSSALVAIIFQQRVTDTGLHLGGLIVAAVSALVLLPTITDHRVRTPAAGHVSAKKSVTGPDEDLHEIRRQTVRGTLQPDWPRRTNPTATT